MIFTLILSSSSAFLSPSPACLSLNRLPCGPVSTWTIAVLIARSPIRRRTAAQWPVGRPRETGRASRWVHLLSASVRVYDCFRLLWPLTPTGIISSPAKSSRLLLPSPTDCSVHENDGFMLNHGLPCNGNEPAARQIVTKLLFPV